MRAAYLSSTLSTDPAADETEAAATEVDGDEAEREWSVEGGHGISVRGATVTSQPEVTPPIPPHL